VEPIPNVPPIFLTGDETRNVLPWPQLIEAAGHAFDRGTEAPQRLVIPDAGQDWVVMPSAVPQGGLVCKLLRVDHRPSGSAPTITGVVALLDAEGRLVALLDGAALTARRTAAVAAYATRLLAPLDASVLAVFGAGALADAHVEAIAEVRKLSEIRVVGRSPVRLHSFCTRMSAKGFAVTPTDASAAVHGASIVVATTTSPTPVFADSDLAPGTHINAVGSYRPERAEVPAATVARARVVVETLESAWSEAGDLIQPCDAGLIGPDHVWAELHEHDRIAQLRTAEPDAITLFKSVGHVALDLAAVEVALAQLHTPGAFHPAGVPA
jgi:ornithine cyclodeaminase